MSEPNSELGRARKIMCHVLDPEYRKAVEGMINYLSDSEDDDWFEWLYENDWLTEAEQDEWLARECTSMFMAEMGDERQLELARAHPQHVYSRVVIAWHHWKGAYGD